jgi:hypothetical protein
VNWEMGTRRGGEIGNGGRKRHRGIGKGGLEGRGIWERGTKRGGGIGKEGPEGGGLGTEEEGAVCFYSPRLERIEMV